MGILKQIFCKHKYERLKQDNGEYVRTHDGVWQIYQCHKCFKMFAGGLPKTKIKVTPTCIRYKEGVELILKKDINNFFHAGDVVTVIEDWGDNNIYVSNGFHRVAITERDIQR